MKRSHCICAHAQSSSCAGGTFAIYSLLCRFARISPVGDVQSGDRSLRRYTSSQGCIADPQHEPNRYEALWRLLMDTMTPGQMPGHC